MQIAFYAQEMAPPRWWSSRPAVRGTCQIAIGSLSTGTHIARSALHRQRTVVFLESGHASLADALTSSIVTQLLLHTDVVVNNNEEHKFANECVQNCLAGRSQPARSIPYDNLSHIQAIWPTPKAMIQVVGSWARINYDTCMSSAIG